MTNETLSQKQARFAQMVALLIQKASALGYAVTLGEAFRPPEVAQIYAREGRGIADSLHTSRLAIDLNLFRDGKYLSRTESYIELGEWWESQGGAWGGRFRKADGNHFSLEHEGKK